MAVTATMCRFSPIRAVTRVPVRVGVAGSAPVAPSYTSSVTLRGALRASHTVTLFRSTRRTIGPARTSSSAATFSVGRAVPPVPALVPTAPTCPPVSAMAARSHLHGIYIRQSYAGRVVVDLRASKGVAPADI